MKSFSLFLALIALIATLVSCEPIEPISTEGCIVLTGRQDVPLVLTNHLTEPNTPDYCVEGRYNIRADVQVEPGVIIVMKDGAKIHVEADGSFKSIGTEEDKVIIRGEKLLTSGQWEYIRFATRSTENRLEYTTVTGGGSDGTYDAMVFINYNGYAKIDHCAISFSQSNGIKCEGRESRLGGLSNTDISICDQYPIHIDAKLLKDISSSNTGLGSTNNQIYVYASQISEPLNWSKSTDMPYYLDGSLSVISDVTIEPGTRIVMGAGANIKVNSGSLNCVGTESEKIRFLSENGTSGSWDFISFIASPSTQNRFEHCVISHGGSDNTYQGMVTLITDSYCRIGNSEISGSAGFGVQIQSQNNTYVDDGNNTFSENALGDTDF